MAKNRNFRETNDTCARAYGADGFFKFQLRARLLSPATRKGRC